MNEIFNKTGGLKKVPFLLYRVLFSPFFHLLGARCRFFPSCSQYAEEAVKRHGWIRGSLLAVGRLVRCHPLATGGVDEVPEFFLGSGDRSKGWSER